MIRSFAGEAHGCSRVKAGSTVNTPVDRKQARAERRMQAAMKRAGAIESLVIILEEFQEAERQPLIDAAVQQVNGT